MNQLALESQPDPDFRTIPLTRGQVAIVDAADYEWLNQWKWSALWAESNKSFYARRTLWPSNESILMHRLIMNTPKGMHTDHRNHHTLDNRRRNLRVATPGQNHANRIVQTNNGSGLKGVRYIRTGKRLKRWTATIAYQGKTVGFPYFATPEEAHEAYNRKALELYGEFALNPDTVTT